MSEIEVSEAMVACVKREIALRERVYPGLVDRGRMTEEKALEEVYTMQQVLEVLLRLRELSDPMGIVKVKS